MIGEIIDLLFDCALTAASGRTRTARLIRIAIGLVVVSLIAGLIYLTVRYS